MQDTPKANRLHIALFGRRNIGKSSLINAITKQDIALVSSVPGTTADPVYKAMELLPLGPVVFIDTAGIDDTGDLGSLRVEKTFEVLNKTDLALLVVSGPRPEQVEYELRLLEVIKEKKIPFIGVFNKSDLGVPDLKSWEETLGIKLLPVSALKGTGIDQLKGRIIKEAPEDFEESLIVRDLVGPGELAVLVVPVDSGAPKGRLILPQVQTIRDILDGDALCLVVKDDKLKEALESIKEQPKIVITDSQVFDRVSKVTPGDIPLTSFSILFARFKGDLEELIRGVEAIKTLKPGDRVLIAEACTHHRQADDIGRLKIPRFLTRYVGGDLQFAWSSGMSYPPDLKDFRLIVHCGACMINKREMLYRIQMAREVGVPIVNYGVLLGFMHGILDRALQPFAQKNK